MFRHVLPNAMVATLTFLPFILNGVHHHADLARLPRLRPAAGLALARRDPRPGQGEPAGAVARHHRLRRPRRDAEPARLHRRGGPRRVRSAEDPETRRAATAAPRWRGPRTSSVSFDHAAAASVGPCAASRSTSSAGETLALVGESGSGKSVTALSILQLLPYPPARHPRGQHPVPGPGAPGRRRGDAPARARQPDRA